MIQINGKKRSLILTENNIEDLEKIDRILLKRIFEAPSSTSTKSLYLESGSIPIRFLIKAKRLMFLHYLLNRGDTELISQVLYAQKEQPIKNDWYSTVLKDLLLLGLDYLEIEDIKSMKKEQFKKLVKDNCKDVALNYLLDGNEERTKLKNLKYYQLSLQSYLTSSKITTRMKKQFFRFRTKMTNVGFNFGNKILCPLCKLENDDQEHLFRCVMIKINCKELYNTEETYENIFSMNSDKTIKIASICESIIKTREKLLAFKICN